MTMLTKWLSTTDGGLFLTAIRHCSLVVAVTDVVSREYFLMHYKIIRCALFIQNTPASRFLNFLI